MRGEVPLDRLVLGRPCVGIRAGRIFAVGREDEVRSLLGAGVEQFDFGDARVLPGLRDSHAHLVMTGLARQEIDLHGMSFAEVRAAVRARTEALPAGTWVRGAGFSLDDLDLGRPPAAGDLDGISPDHPIRLASHDLHALWVSSKALELAGRPAESASYLTEDEIRLFMDAAGRPGPEERLAATRQVLAEFHANGITAAQEHLRLGELETLLALAGEGSLSMRVRYSVRDHEFTEFLDRREELPEIPGLLESNGQKMFLDGALGSRTAWMIEPYLDTGEFGERTRDTKVARESVARAARAGLPTFYHAIGDAAVREALDLSESAPGFPHRVEHAQVIHPDDLPRFAAQGVIASVQPVHLLTDTPGILKRWGKERAARCFPVRSLLAAGVEVRFGSDTPVETLDPMKGVFAAATRRTLSGEVLPGEETIPAETALSLYLSFPAIEPGRPGDLSVWEKDPATVPTDELPEQTPLATVFAGDLIHSR